MKTSLARHLIAAALLAALAACGNKGPLVKPSATEPTSDVAPAPAAPTDTSTPEAAPVPPVDAPETTTPPDVPPADDSGDNS
jgi:predicted small lipoprotein YifL